MTANRPRARLLRSLVPALLVVVWLGLASFGGPLFGRISEVSSNDPTAYLPTSAEATQVQKQLTGFLGSDAIPAVVVAVRDSGLTEADLAALGTAAEAAATLPEVAGGASPAIPSEDGKAVQVFVPLSTQSDLGEGVEAIRAAFAADVPDGVEVLVTGPAGLSADLGDAFAGIDGLLLGVALAAVLIILVVVYRSPVLPLLVLMTSVFALCAALATVWLLAKEGVVLLSGQTQGILFILVIGAATDYGLLYVSRFREELRVQPDRWAATRAALRGAREPILASGGTVVAGLLCLLLSDLQSNRDLGPIAAIGIVWAMIASFTLLPALLALTGGAAFWPRRPQPLTAEQAADPHTRMPQRGLWHALPGAVARRPRALWVGTTAVLLLACVGLTQLKADGVAQSDLVMGDSPARTGQQLLAQHFPGGSGSPTYVLAPEAGLDEVARTVLGTQGVASLAVTAKDSPSGTAPVTADGIQAVGRPGTEPPAPTVVDGQVLLQATLTDAADSAAAESTVRALRASVGDDVLVGGSTATAIDSDDASVHDRNLIIPVVLLVILIILGLLLRAVVAPILLIATVVLSFGATLGVSALVFNHVLDMPGADPAVPLFGFVFLVALGIDYNIFLMTRVREESLAHGTHHGITRGLAITGGVITSAGLVLAATFGALAVLPILFLVQLAFIVAFGVLIDTFLVRTVLVPALGYDLGRVIWWPSRLAKGER
ncbi:MMPL family transporter [Sanguibacter sp. HDW7]|uniref:MMPL family transporter n=1 Tax=Sanguibacter sp. HDW7 TaxID=2714931 RepID=UPI00140E7F24|nr:MMPL family transporter [Sanguibacter sp. HDW7]QIK84230.1 MMPL family transporter [Sanguibacter sp. HDW7]